MLTPMSSWLESVMIALAFCCFTSCRAPARAMSGALPELASATSKRTVLPDCFSAWLACVTASRIDSAQLSVASEPVRSISWPRTITEPFDARGASAAGLHAAAQSARAKKILFIIFSRSRCVGGRRIRNVDLHTGTARRRRFDLRGHSGGPRSASARINRPAPRPGARRSCLAFQESSCRSSSIGFPRTANAGRQGSSKRGVLECKAKPGAARHACRAMWAGASLVVLHAHPQLGGRDAQTAAGEDRQILLVRHRVLHVGHARQGADLEAGAAVVLFPPADDEED